MDRLTPEQRHKNMSNIKNKNTSIELILRKALRSHGYGYRVNYKGLPGKPDIVLTKYKIVIFCDSEFFHGYDFERLKLQLKKGDHADFWINKISRNMSRDDEVNKLLESMGWKVLRFWGNEIKKHPEDCIKAIKEAMIENIIHADNFEL